MLGRHYNKIKETRKGGFISNAELSDLMMQIDLPSLMTRLGINFAPEIRNGEYCGFCPDHVTRKGKEPDKPKWYISAKTGKTFCHTEGHASNIVEITRILLGLETQREAIEKILDGKELRRTSALERRVLQSDDNSEREEKKIKNRMSLQECLDKINFVFRDKEMPKEFLDYFAKDGIHQSVLEQQSVYFCGAGYYANRAIIPFKNVEREVCGFVAVDILGIDKWMDEQVERYKKIYGGKVDDNFLMECRSRYRKVLFCPGMESDKHLYGLYEGLGFNTQSPYVLLVEGERDCLKMIQEGIPCLAIHGTNLGISKANIIKRLNKTVILGFDMDEAGRDAVRKIGSMLLDSPFDVPDVYSVSFPDDKDPKKFSKAEMLQIIENKVRLNLIELKEVERIANGK